MDYRHPIQQIANRWMAEYRDYMDCAALDSRLDILEAYVNHAIAEINKAGEFVFMDGTQQAIEGVCLSWAENSRGKRLLNVEFIPRD